MNIKKTVVALKALAHPHRLTIFLRLAKCCVKNECTDGSCPSSCIGDLGRGLAIGQSTLSHHLKELTRAGLVRTRKCGQSTLCWVPATTVDDLAQFFLQAKST